LHKVDIIWAKGGPDIRPEQNLHNNTLLYHAIEGFENVLFAEAEAKYAYRGVLTEIGDYYRRFLATVPISEGNSYLIDIFRIKGAKKTEYILKGSPEPYSLLTPYDMVEVNYHIGPEMVIWPPAPATDQQKIHVFAETLINESLMATFDYGDVKVRIHMAACEDTKLMTGKALKSIKKGGLKEYLILAREGEASEEHAYLAVHESFRENSQIKSITELKVNGKGTAKAMKIELEQGIKDYIIQTIDEGPQYPRYTVSGNFPITFSGRSVHIRTKKDKISWMQAVQAAELLAGGIQLIEKGCPTEFRGIIVRVNRMAKGAKENSFIIDGKIPEGNNFANQTIIVTWKNGWKWGFKIKFAKKNTIILEDDPGFDVLGEKIYNRYYPIGEYKGPATFLISGYAEWRK